MTTPNTAAEVEDLDILAGAGDASEYEENGAEADYGDDFTPTSDADDAKPEPTEQPDPEPEPADGPEPDAEPEPEEDDAGKTDEPEPEESDEPEAPESAESDESPEPEKKEHKIPKSRFDEVNEKRKKLLTEVEQFRAEQDARNAGVDFDFEAKEREYAELMLDGEIDTALGVRGEINAAIESRAEARIKAAAAETTEVTKQSLSIDSVINQLETEYPALKKGGEGYDQNAVDEILTLQRGFIAQDFNPVDALELAASYVTPRLAPQPGEDNLADEPAEKPAEEKPAITKKPVDLKAKIAASNKQPPDMAGDGNSTELSMDINTMSEDEFDALPESTRARLRGDIL